MAEGSKEELLAKLIDSVPVLLILLGVAVLVLGLAGGVTYNNWLPIVDQPGRIGAVVVGAGILGLGFFGWRTRVIVPKAKDFGITIDHPKDGDLVGIVNVRGRIKKAIPDGYTLQVFRCYAGKHSYVPIGKGDIEPEKGTWNASQCDVGGRPGDTRIIRAYLVGPNGAAVLDYWFKAKNVHKRVREQLRDLTGKEPDYLPPIDMHTTDMIPCARVEVRRS